MIDFFYCLTLSDALKSITFLKSLSIYFYNYYRYSKRQLDNADCYKVQNMSLKTKNQSFCRIPLKWFNSVFF